VTIAIRLLNYPFAGAHVGNTRAALMDCTWRCRLNPQEIPIPHLPQFYRTLRNKSQGFPCRAISSVRSEKKDVNRENMIVRDLFLHFLRLPRSTIFLMIRISFPIRCTVTKYKNSNENRFIFFRNLFTSFYLYTFLSK